jgi:hypothetical protein
MSTSDFDPILVYFRYEHLPEHLQDVSAPFRKLAFQMVENLPPGPEVSAGLRKLLEAKDCAVRAALAQGSS